MNSRMEKYNQDGINARTKRNEKLYDNITDLDAEYIDINNAIEINSNKNNGKITRSEYQRKKEIDKLIPSTKKEKEENEEEIKENIRVYDINEILKLARENKLFENDDKKRLINTEYNILTKLDMSQIEESKDNSKENLRKLIDTIYGTSEKNNLEKEQTEKIKVEKNGLLDDLLNDNDIVLTEETSKFILDKEETVELKKDNDKIKEGQIKTGKIPLEDNENTTNDETTIPLNIQNSMATEFIDIELKKGKKVLVLIIIIVLLLLLISGYLFYKYFI